MNILITICARGGSKGVPKKNLLKLDGKSLLELAITKGLALKESIDVIVSTDNNEIADVARKAGAKVPFMRPANLAIDTAPKFPVLKHALKESEKIFNKRYDIIVDLDVSVPFTTKDDITKAIQMMKDDQATDTLVAAYVSDHNPYFNMMEEKHGYLTLCKKPQSSLNRRQDAPTVYQLTAGILVTRRNILLEGNSLYTNKVKAFVMPLQRSVMIDNELDFQFAKFLIQNKIVKLG
ncbi:acylneuraminate cytidylyltransferase family protein [Candidatus Micrarchaeota archaeon]|nr:acylneuraminate cytidylyltransferase family protein [Candidatus Micrarchaeota archaeon]